MKIITEYLSNKGNFLILFYLLGGLSGTLMFGFASNLFGSKKSILLGK